jgi:hypothetical protein
MMLADQIEEDNNSSKAVMPVFTGGGSPRVFDIGMMDNPSAIQSDVGYE